MTIKQYKFKQHMPNFVESDPFEYDYHDTKSLLENEWINSWKGFEGFYQFSISKDALRDRYLLVAQFDNGERWYVLGYLENPDVIDLPTWRAVYKNDNTTI